MKTPRLLIADSDTDFCQALCQELEGEFDIRIASNGAAAWECLQGFAPEVFLLDLLLPEIDGISLLQLCQKERLQPFTLVTTQLYTPYVLCALQQFSISYLLRKPCSADSVCRQIRAWQFAPAIPSTPSKQESISSVLLHLGFSQKLKGSCYLPCAIDILSESRESMLAKELYGTVAKQYHASAAQVERAIRTAIARAWDRGDRRIWRRYFPARDTLASRRPTNAELIYRLAQLAFDQKQGITGAPL